MAYNLTPKSYEFEEELSADTFTEERSVLYPNGIAFDYEAGDFSRDGKHRMMDSNGIESWKSWCINCLQTERYSCLAYSTDFGIETDAVFGAESPEEAESVLMQQITEAILADPYERAQYVSDIVITWVSPDAITCEVIIQGIDDVTIDITAYITKGGV